MRVVTGSSDATGSSAVKDHVGALHQGPRDAHALLLAAGELIGARMELVRETHGLERAHAGGVILMRKEPEDASPGRVVAQAAREHVALHGAALDQVESLRHHADAPADEAKDALGGRR